MKLLQLNIFLRPPPVNSLGGEYKDARMEHFMTEFIDRFDIVCLQECFGTLSSRRARLIQLAQDRGFKGSCYSDRGCMLGCDGTFKFTDGGLVILSRNPMTYTQFRMFSAGCDVDKLAAKGILYARIDLQDKEGRQLHVFTTHTQASYNFAASEASIHAKRSQMCEMAQFIREMTKDYPATWPIIVTGDFNMDSLQDKCPEYETCMEELAGCSRFLSATSNTTFYDVIKSRHGAFLPTTVPFEWIASSGLAIRSNFLTKDRRDYEELVSLQTKIANGDICGVLASTSRVENKGISTSSSFIGDRTTFWCDQCLDYVFFENGSGLVIRDAYIDSLQCDASVLPYSQISDHHGICVDFTVV